MKREVTFLGFGIRAEFRIPARQWRRMVRAADGDEQLARMQLATAFMVACSNVADPPEPARPRQPVPYLPPEYAAKEAGELPPISQEDPLGEDGYLVQEATMVEMPVHDPWARNWD